MIAQEFFFIDDDDACDDHAYCTGSPLCRRGKVARR